MIDKKKAKQEYKTAVSPKGIFAVTNTKTGRVFLGGSTNLYNIVERVACRLNANNYPNEALLRDWKALGADNFKIEILETLPFNDDPLYNYDEDLKILEMLWVDKFRPLAEKTYNEREDIRIRNRCQASLTILT